MAEQEYEQRMRELQRAYVEFLDDSTRDGVYDRLVFQMKFRGFTYFVFLGASGT